MTSTPHPEPSSQKSNMRLERRLKELREYAVRMKKHQRISWVLMSLFAFSALFLFVWIWMELILHGQQARHGGSMEMSWELIVPFSCMLTMLGHFIFVEVAMERPFKRPHAKIAAEEYRGQALEEELRDLARQAGSQALGTLLDVVRTTDSDVIKRAVYPALIALLLQVRNTDVHCVDRSQREFLYRMLKPLEETPSYDAWRDDFQFAILKALEHIGDSHAIPLVEQLANREPNSHSERKVRDAARDCQLCLWQNSSRVDAAEILVRASHPPTL